MDILQNNSESLNADEEPLISVIMAAYNAEKYIGKTIKSVLNQTHKKLELIVVNDGSTDGTLKELEKIKDERLKILSQENGGAAKARNYGFSESKGEYISFLDADDRWFPDKLEKDLKAIERCGERECIIYSWYYCVDEKDRLINLSPKIESEGDIYEEVLKKEGGILLPSTTLIHRKIFEEIGGFNENQYHEDRVFFVKATKKYKAYPSLERNVIYLQSTGGKCRSVLNDFERALEPTLKIIEYFRTSLPPEELAALEKTEKHGLVYRFLMYGHLDFAKRLYAQIDKKDFRRGKKGILAFLSLRTGINFLYLARVCLQFAMKFSSMFWWRAKIASLSG